MSSDRFADARGVIQDLLMTPLDSVTEIFSVKEAIRGNHVHKATTQWTYVVAGRLLIATAAPGSDGRNPVDLCERVYGPECPDGRLACELPGVPHAWRALEPTLVLVFTQGPRAGSAYESDTTRLEVPLL